MDCPFCHDNDFDLVGLKIHLTEGFCEPFESTVLPATRRTAEMDQHFVRAQGELNHD